MVLRIVAEGMNAYYNRDPIALRALLERIEEQRPRMSAHDAQLLDAIVKEWVKQSHRLEPANDHTPTL